MELETLDSSTEPDSVADESASMASDATEIAVKTTEPTVATTQATTKNTEVETGDYTTVDTGNNATEMSTTVVTTHYVINTNTKKFHYPSCSSVKDINSENRWDYHGTRDDVIGMGYVPCKKCDP